MTDHDELIGVFVAHYDLATYWLAASEYSDRPAECLAVAQANATLAVALAQVITATTTSRRAATAPATTKESD